MALMRPGGEGGLEVAREVGVSRAGRCSGTAPPCRPALIDWQVAGWATAEGGWPCATRLSPQGHTLCSHAASPHQRLAGLGLRAVLHGTSACPASSSTSQPSHASTMHSPPCIGRVCVSTSWESRRSTSRRGVRFRTSLHCATLLPPRASCRACVSTSWRCTSCPRRSSSASPCSPSHASATRPPCCRIRRWSAGEAGWGGSGWVRRCCRHTASSQIPRSPLQSIRRLAGMHASDE